jgi:predicted RND superfamily exporter protein
LLFSDYSPVQYLGLFMSINIMVALISDLILLPSLLSIKKWRRHSTEQQGVYKIH